MIVPIFHWLEIGEDPDQSLLSSQDIMDLSAVLGSSETTIFTVLRDVLQSSTWVERSHWFPTLKGVLLRQCARYLYVAKKRGYVMNPVGVYATVVCFKVDYTLKIMLRSGNGSIWCCRTCIGLNCLTMKEPNSSAAFTVCSQANVWL